MSLQEITNKELDTVVNYMVVSFGYDYNLVLPYKDGIALLASIEKAEPIERYYAGNKVVFNDKSKEIEIHTISQKDYREQKMAKLLGVPDGI